MTAYNLRRIINILGIERFRKYLQYLTDLFFGKTAVFDRILAYVDISWKNEILEPETNNAGQPAIFNHYNSTPQEFLDRLPFDLHRLKGKSL